MNAPAVTVALGAAATIAFSVAARPLLAAQQSNLSQQTFQGPPPGGPGRGGPPPGGPLPSGTPRDGRGTLPVGTSAIRGRVVAADTGRPLRRARIVVNAPELGPMPANTSTNADGRYEIKDLPAGRYTVTVNRSGYLNLRYGQRRPFEQGKPIQVADKQTVDNIDFALPRMSVITGRVFDETGDPISGVRMFAMRSTYFEGRRRMVPVAGGFAVQTDDAGQYRLLGLAPGTYFVMGDMRETWTVTEGGNEQVLGYVPTYFPGTTNVADARRVTVGLGQEVGNNDFALIPGRAANISGVATDSQGRPFAGRQVRLSQQWRGPGFGMATSGPASSQTAADGTFRIKNLAPGEYMLQVSGTVDVNGSPVQESASLPIRADGVDLDDILLASSAGWTVSGQIVMDTGQPPTAPRDRIRVVPRVLNGDFALGGPGAGPDNGRVKDDWSFTATVGSAARLRATTPDNVMITAILQDGRDVTDNVFDLRSGDTLSGIQIVLSARVNTVSGQLTDGRGAPLADGTIIVFSSNSEKWFEDSRFVRSARPDQEGKYQVRGLPPGEYLAVAIDYVEEGTWNDPEYLESIRRYAEKVNVAEGGTSTVSLKLITP